jgi:PST family polysaccharide transporter
LNLAITGIQLSLLAISLPLVSRFYTQPELPSLLAVLAAVFLIKQLGIIPDALVRRRLNYRPLVIRDSLCDLSSASLSIALAIAGWGIWSLLIPQLVLEPIRFLAILSIARWRPQLHFGLKDWPKIGRYSASLIGANLLSLVANDGDTLLVGKVLGSQALGYYNLAWQLSNIVGRNITGVISNIGMPALAMLNQNQARLQAAYQRVIRLLATGSFPILSGMFALADDLIRLVYGARWEPAVILLRLFIVFTAIRSVTSLTGVIYSVVGRPDVSFKFTIGLLPFYLAGICVGSHWGVVGVATGVMVVRATGGLIDLAVSSRLIQMPLSNGVSAMLPAGILAAVMSGIVWGVQVALKTNNVELLGRLVLCVSFGALLYLSGLLIFERRSHGEIASIISAVSPSIGVRLTSLFRHPLFSFSRKLL